MSTTSPSTDAATPVIIDTESGTRSVAGYIKRGEIKVKDASSFKAVEDYIWTLEGSKARPSGLALDTMTGLATRSAYDVGHDAIPKGGIWTNRMSLPTTQPQWGIMSTCFMLLLRVAAQLGIPLILTAHEGERNDEASGTTLHFPDLNPMLLKYLVNNSDAVIRVSRASGIFEADGERFAVGDRVLRLQPNDKYYAKFRVPDDAKPAPDTIGQASKESNWQHAVEKIYKIGQGPLRVIILYGAPGVGKTRLATELLLYYNKMKEKN